MGKIIEGIKIFYDMLFGKMSKTKIKKINAAFGSFLLVILTSLTNPLSTIINDGIWGQYFMLVWLAMLGFLSILIISFFGSTEQTPLADALVREGLDIEALKDLQANALKIIANLEDIADGT